MDGMSAALVAEKLRMLDLNTLTPIECIEYAI
jgi:hypothetical protein